MKRIISLVLTIAVLVVIAAGCAGGKPEIVFADAGWESNKFHNAVAGVIAEEIFGYVWTEVPGSTSVLHEGLLKGEVDVHMEEWTDNIPQYQSDVESGRLQELAINFNDNYQGIYVPRYVIEGDAERGIAASAPDLKYVWDLKDYPDLFSDDEVKSKGRIYGAIPGWEVDTILERKYKHYGLDENFIYFRPGSDPALQSAIVSAYDKGEPIAAYYWEPTWLLGKYDMVLLEDEPYIDDQSFKEGKTELPAMNVTVAVSNDFYENEDNAGFVTFLKNYRTSSALTSEGLAYMQDTSSNYVEAAKWFLSRHPELLDGWLNEKDAGTMKDILAGQE